MEDNKAFVKPYPVPTPAGTKFRVLQCTQCKCWFTADDIPNHPSRCWDCVNAQYGLKLEDVVNDIIDAVLSPSIYVMSAKDLLDGLTDVVASKRVETLPNGKRRIRPATTCKNALLRCEVCQACYSCVDGMFAANMGCTDDSCPRFIPSV